MNDLKPMLLSLTLAIFLGSGLLVLPYLTSHYSLTGGVPATTTNTNNTGTGSASGNSTGNSTARDTFGSQTNGNTQLATGPSSTNATASPNNTAGPSPGRIYMVPALILVLALLLSFSLSRVATRRLSSL